MNIWTLPRQTVIDGKVWPHATDYRDILKIVSVFQNAENEQFAPLCAAILFYRDPLFHADAKEMEALLEYMVDFINCGQKKEICLCADIIDWELDAQEILEGVNAAAGIDIREKEELHWWSFMSLFHCIRRGRLADLVAIRWKLQTGKPLTDEEKAYVHACPDKFRPRESAEDKQYRKQLEEMLR